MARAQVPPSPDHPEPLGRARLHQGHVDVQLHPAHQAHHHLRVCRKCALISSLTSKCTADLDNVAKGWAVKEV